nr:MAG TPA: hypothetical protein [Caudoviricetes sp.]
MWKAKYKAVLWLVIHCVNVQKNAISFCRKGVLAWRELLKD